MTIHHTAFDTTAAKHYLIDNVQHKLLAAIHTSGTYPLVYSAEARSGEPRVMHALVGGNSHADAVPFFRHPLLVVDRSESYLSIDLRDYGKFDAMKGGFTVRNSAEFSFACKRLALNQVWLDGGYAKLRDVSGIPAATYAALISDTLTKRFYLDAGEQIQIQIYAAYFYYTLFTDKAFGDSELIRVVHKIKEATRAPADMILAITDKIDPDGLKTLGDLVALIKDNIKNPTLDNLNLGTLLEVTCGTWMGGNSRELVAVSMEHVPTWIAMVHASLQQATYKRSVLNKLSSRYERGNAGENFDKGLNYVLGGTDAFSHEFAGFKSSPDWFVQKYKDFY